MAERRQRPLVWYLAAGYPAAGGVEAYLLHYATEMRRQGFDPRILVFEPLPRTPHRFLVALRERGLPIESLMAGVRRQVALLGAALWVPWALRTVVRQRRRPESAAFYRWLSKRRAVAALARRIRAEAPDVIHVKGRLPGEAWAVLPAERTIFHINTAGQRDASWTDVEAVALRDFAQRAARVFAPGTAVAETFRREFGVERRVDVVFTMAPDEGELQRFGPESQRPADAALRFGTLCRFSRGKGIPLILDALREYQARHGDVHFTFAGSGELEPEMRAFVQAHGLTHVDIEPVATPAASLRAMDVFVHPSLSEAMPVAIVEALMSGLPCIVTRVGGMPDLVRDHVEGRVIEPNSAAAIREALEGLAALPAAERRAMGRRARARYDAVCRPELVGAIVAGHYRAIMAAAGGRGVCASV